MADDKSAPASLALVGATTAPLDLRSFADILVKSKLFPERDAAQAIVKVLLGREFGFGPMNSITGIHTIEGKPSLSARLLSSRIQNSGRFRYRVRQLDNKGCTLEFFERVDGLGPPWEWEAVGLSTFTHEDAVIAGTAFKLNYKKNPRNMFFARAISNGIAWYCPGLFGGPVYTPEDFGYETDENGAVVGASDIIVRDPSSGEPVGLDPAKMPADMREAMHRLATREQRDAPSTDVVFHGFDAIDVKKVANAAADIQIRAMVVGELDKLGDWRTKKSITRAIFGEWVESVEHLALLAEQSPDVWREGLARLGLVDG